MICLMFQIMRDYFLPRRHIFVTPPLPRHASFICPCIRRVAFITLAAAAADGDAAAMLMLR